MDYGIVPHLLRKELIGNKLAKTGIYKKVGRRYVEIGEFDPEYIDHVPNGVTMTVKRPGMQSTRYNVDPDIVPLLAASLYCEDQISNAIYRAGELRPYNRSITPEQRVAFDNFLATMPEDDSNRFMMTVGSARDAAEAGTQALVVEAEKLLANESIKNAYEHFLLLCKLSAQKDPAKPA
jgi:hypothetical protein